MPLTMIEPAPTPTHRWRVSHVDAAGQRRMRLVTAASSWLALNWMEQLYGTPRACAAIRLTPATAAHATAATPTP